MSSTLPTIVVHIGEVNNTDETEVRFVTALTYLLPAAYGVEIELVKPRLEPNEQNYEQGNLIDLVFELPRRFIDYGKPGGALPPISFATHKQLQLSLRNLMGEKFSYVLVQATPTAGAPDHSGAIQQAERFAAAELARHEPVGLNTALISLGCD